jgi:hypothetical protein
MTNFEIINHFLTIFMKSTFIHSLLSTLFCVTIALFFGVLSWLAPAQVTKTLSVLPVLIVALMTLLFAFVLYRLALWQMLRPLQRIYSSKAMQEAMLCLVLYLAFAHRREC